MLERGNMIRRALRRLLRIALILVCAFAAGTLVPRPLLAPDRTVRASPSRQILVVSNAIHTDIAIPIDAGLRSRFAFLREAGVPLDHPGARWLVLGWGGRAFYLETPTWADLKPLPLLKALTIDRSVLHVDVAGAIAASNPAVRGFYVDEAGQERLLAVIEASFARDAGAPVPVPDRSYGETDRFFEANASFNAFLGCNTWTAAALRAAGLRTGWWNPLPMSLVLSLDLHT